MKKNIIKCGDANPNGNVAFFYKGGCRKEVDKVEAYRCTGCDGWFHKDCIMEHFKMEQKHDVGRNDLKTKIKKMLNSINNNESHPYINEIEKAEGYFYAIKQVKTLIKKIK